MHYDVTCDDGKAFKTKENVTGVFLPLPYHWGNYARATLAEELKSRGYTTKIAFRISEEKDDGDAILVFSKNEPVGTRYCSVEKG